MAVLDVFIFILLIFICIGLGYYIYKDIIKKKVEEKLSNQISKSIKKNMKKDNSDIIPKEWFSNENAPDLEKFMDNTIETNLNGKDLMSFISGLSNTSDGMLSNIYSQMLRPDSEILKNLSEKLGITPGIARPILIYAFTGVGKIAKSLLTNVLKDKFNDRIKNKKPKVKSKKKIINSEQSIGLTNITF